MDSVFIKGSGSSDLSTRSRRFLIVANRTGGQGKTLLSHVLTAGLRQSDPNFGVMCADSQEMIDGVAISKLGRSVKGVYEVGAGPSPTEIQDNPTLALSFWDRIGAPLVDGSGRGYLLDVGANVIDQIMDWAGTAELDVVFDGQVDVDLVVPVVATGKSLADARDVVSRMRAAGGFPVRHVFLVENGWQGSFAPFSGDENHKALRRAVSETGGSIIAVPQCRSEVLDESERRHLYLGDVMSFSAHDIATGFDWPLIKASREFRRFRLWLEAVLKSFGEAGLLKPWSAPKVDIEGDTASLPSI